MHVLYSFNGYLHTYMVACKTVSYHDVFYYLLYIAVQFVNNASSAIESEHNISFTVITLVPSYRSFSVQVGTREITQSAEGLLETSVIIQTRIYVMYACILYVYS